MATLAAVPAPLAARLWLAVPLVLVPRLGPQTSAHGAPIATYPWLAVLAGVAAAAALAWPPGAWVGAVLAVPWLALVLAGLAVDLARLQTDRSPGSLAGFVADGFLVVGAGFLVCHRLAIDPMGFGSTIVLLTVVHFSVAGFALVAIGGLLASGGSRVAWAGVVGLVVGIPLTALGWMIGTPMAAWPGATTVAASGLLVAAALARLSGSGRAARVGAAAALGVGMAMAIGWASALAWGIPYVDLETMVRTHGALNLLAVIVASFAIPVAAPVAGSAHPRLRWAR
jgi:hypothetical protein